MIIPKKIKIISAILSLLGLSLGTSLAAGPAGVTDAALWLDAAQLTGLIDGQTVSTWTDMSGSGNSPVAAGGVATYRANVVNGQPVVRFSADGNATFNFTRISTIRTVFWVLKNTNPGEHFMLGDSGSYDFHAGNPALWNGTYVHANIQNGKTRLMGSVINGTATTLPSSSFSLVSLITAGNVVANQLSLDRGIGGRSWAGDMAEVVIYTRALSTAEELAVNIYLANKYGLVLAQNVPGDIYWDNNGSAAGFGTAAGTWAAPTTGDSSQGWSTDPTGSTLPAGFTTAVTNALRFGSADAGLAAGTVTVSGDVTASNITFASSSGGITLTGGRITLADTTTIAVNNSGDTISGVLAGAATRLTKSGLGTLALNGNNTFSGDIFIVQGVLSSQSVGLRGTSGNVFVSAGAALAVNTGWGQGMANPIFLSGTGNGGYGALHGENNFICSGPITLLTDSKITHNWNWFELRGPITGADKNLELGITVDGQYPIYMSSSVNLGTGMLKVDSVQNGGTGDGCAVALNAANTYSGGTVLTNYAILRLGNANALGSGGVTLNQNSKLNLNTFNVTVGALSGPGGIITDWNGAAGTTTLTVNQSTNTTYSGVISNGASRVIAFTKTGSGTLTLAGRNTYSGATTINAGGLIGGTGGSCLNSSVIVADGAACGVRVASFNGQWVCSNLTYSAGTTTLDINFGGSQPSATIAPLRVAGDLNMGTVGITVRNGLWSTTPGTYPLISYAGTLSGTVPASALSLPAGLTATLVNNTGSKRIDLNVTAVNWAPSSYNTWTNLVSGNASGTWGTAANWSNSIPDSVDAMADFSTLNITAGAYVNNEAPRTVGQLRFGDTTPGNDWVLTNAALTLATTVVQPVIDVSNGNASINSVLLGTQGFVKQGSGTLWISGKSTMAGDITVSQGMLGNTLGGLRWTTGNVIVSTGATLYATSGWGDGDSHAMPNPIFLSGTGMNANYGALHGQANFDCNGPITLLTDSKISHDWNNFSLNGAITGTDKNLILSAENATSQPGLWVNGSMSLGSGAITVIGSGYVRLNAAHSFSGGTTVSKGNDGALVLYNINALGTGGLTVNRGVVDLNYQSISIPSLSGTGGRITDAGAAGTTTLTVNQATNTTYSGVITNGATRVLALVKSGSGLLTLSATNTYTGATAISNGTLAVNGALSSSGVTVCTGAAFAAGTTGVVGRAVLGGTLAFQDTSRLLVDVASVTADAVVAAGDVVIGTGVEVRLSGNQEKSGSWEIIKSTAGTVQGSDPVLIGGLHGAKLSRTTTAIVLTIPPMGTMIRVL